MINFGELKIYFIFFISTVLMSGCFSVKSVSVGKVKDFKLENVTVDDMTFSVKATVKNPNNFKIKITKVKLKASLENKVIGKVIKVNCVSIPPNSNQLHEIKAKIKLSENYSNISDLMELSLNRSSLKFDGFIKVRTFIFSKRIPVNEKNIMKFLNY